MKIDIYKRDKETLLMAMVDAMNCVEVQAQAYEPVYGVKDKHMAIQKKYAEGILKRYKDLDAKMRAQLNKCQ